MSSTSKAIALSLADEKEIDDFLPDDPPVEGMTQKMVNFVDCLIINRGNKTQSYIDAGYAASNRNIAGVEGHKLLKNPKVQKFLAWRLRQLRVAENMEVKQQLVVRELNRLAYSSLGDVCEWDDEGVVTMKNMDDLTDDVVAAIKKVKCTRRIQRTKDGDEYETVTLEAEMHDKKGPLEILSRASKLVGDKGAAPVPVYLNLNFGGDPIRGAKVEEKVVKSDQVVSDQ